LCSFFFAECEEWSVEKWRHALNDLFSHLHATIRASFIANFSAPAAPVPGHAFSNSRPPAEQRHVDVRGIVRNAAGDPIHGGSTATLVVMVKDANGCGATLVTANVGDSTAFLVPTRGTWDFLSVDHGPENQDEWLRINNPASAPARQFVASTNSAAAAASPASAAAAAGSGSPEPVDPYPTKLLFVYDKTNVFRKYECPCVFLPDGTKDQQFVANPWGHGLHPTNVRYEPAVYAVTPRSVSKDSTCIAMSRALGDYYAHQFGLTHQPSISVKRISCADSKSDDTSQSHMNSYATSEQAYTIFVASDGVWDVWRYDDLMQVREKHTQTHSSALLPLCRLFFHLPRLPC
jgi:serine/threonine protein phosphatase PrpC